MPFDATTTPPACPASEAERLCNLALGFTGGKTTLTDRRAAALNAFTLARCSDDPMIDWQEIALALASVMPKPKAPAAASPSPDAPEWDDYTPAQERGTHRSFTRRRARVRFADGETVDVPLMHRNNRAAPNWRRAASTAVRFYKARRLRNFLRLTGDHELATGGVLSRAAIYCERSAVPEIVEMIDTTRDVAADAARATDATEAERAGVAYLSDLAGIAAECGGDWRQAWHTAKAMTYRAMERAA